jgi:hypothetical protein
MTLTHYPIKSLRPDPPHLKRTSCRRSLLTQCAIFTVIWLGGLTCAKAGDIELTGFTVTPHLRLETMRYRREPEPADGARVQLFLRHGGPADAPPLVIRADAPMRFNSQSPAELLSTHAWAWHDTPAALPGTQLELPSGAMTVWTFNGRVAPWGAGGRISIELGSKERTWLSTNLTLAVPTAWLSAVTFLAPENVIHPDTMVVHLANEGDQPFTIRSCRLWLPQSPKSPRALFPQAVMTNLLCFAGNPVVSPGDKGGFTLKTAPLPLTYCALEVEVAPPDGKALSLWTHLRLKPERFDISGGWVNPVTKELYLKTLRRMHVNTAHLQNTPGYTDTELYARYPLKYFNQLKPFETYDTDTMLPRIHAVEFLGEPQYGGGRPVPPQEVWEKLQPYSVTRLPTSVTHSEERIWRDYAGLSDFPHFDAYRVSAPAADAWSKYDRWDGQTIRWGAPLETIGDMTRSLRELNRPSPIAYWSQGAGDGWEVYGGRKRTSPTPEELRAQAYHALAHRITSLYWFNLSLKSLLKFPDLIEPITRVDREIRLLEDFYLEGDAYHFERRTRDGKPDWDIAVVAGPRGAVCFALDLAYVPDPTEKAFKFGPPRDFTMDFPLPAYLRPPAEVLRVDADAIQAVSFTNTANGIRFTERCGLVNIFAASLRPGLVEELKAHRQSLIEFEESFGFDPGRRAEDLEQLRRLVKP